MRLIRAVIPVLSPLSQESWSRKDAALKTYWGVKWKGWVETLQMLRADEAAKKILTDECCLKWYQHNMIVLTVFCLPALKDEGRMADVVFLPHTGQRALTELGGAIIW